MIIVINSHSKSNIALQHLLESLKENEINYCDVIVVIGGSFFSTSSGLRLLKIYFLFKYSINEILSYSRPNNVYTNKFHLIDSNIEQKDINKYFLSVLIFVISLCLITSLLTILTINL